MEHKISEKLRVAQQLMKSPVLYETRMFPDPYPESYQSSPHSQTPFPYEPSLILSSHLRLGLPSGRFLLDLWTKVLRAFFTSIPSLL